MWRAIEELEGSAQTAAEDAGATERELLTKAPTTRAGVLRLLRHLADFLDEDDVVSPSSSGSRWHERANLAFEKAAARDADRVLHVPPPLLACWHGLRRFRQVARDIARNDGASSPNSATGHVSGRAVRRTGKPLCPSHASAHANMDFALLT